MFEYLIGSKLDRMGDPPMKKLDRFLRAKEVVELGETEGMMATIVNTATSKTQPRLQQNVRGTPAKIDGDVNEVGGGIDQVTEMRG